MTAPSNDYNSLTIHITDGYRRGVWNGLCRPSEQFSLALDCPFLGGQCGQPCLPRWGRWHGVSRDGEGLFPTAHTIPRCCPLSRLRRQLSQRESQVGCFSFVGAFWLGTSISGGFAVPHPSRLRRATFLLGEGFSLPSLFGAGGCFYAAPLIRHGFAVPPSPEGEGFGAVEPGRCRGKPTWAAGACPRPTKGTFPFAPND